MMKTVCVFDDLIELLDRGLNKNLLRRSDTLAAKISKWPKKSTRREPSRACDAEKGFTQRCKTLFDLALRPEGPEGLNTGSAEDVSEGVEQLRRDRVVVERD